MSMSQKSEPVFIVQRRAHHRDVMTKPKPGPWENLRVADDRIDAREYVARLNKRAGKFEYRVDPRRSTKL
jgi:hypothetical protein